MYRLINIVFLLLVFVIVNLSMTYAENNQPIVLNGQISERYQAPDNEPGIVGLDMEIAPNHYPVIKNIFTGTPAEQAGLKPGDIIMEIDGHPTWGKNSQTIDWMISDIPGTPILFTCRRGASIVETSLKVAPRSGLRGAILQEFKP